MKFFTLSLFLLMFSTYYSSAQNFADSVLLLNGKSYRCNIKGMEGPSLHFEIKNKKGKIEQYFIADYRINSYYKNGIETAVYKQDDEIGNFLTYNESKRYAIGAYDARQTYKPYYVFWSSFALSYATSLWDTYLPKSVANDTNHVDYPNINTGFFQKRPTILPFTVPILLSVSFGLPNMRVKQKYILHQEGYGDKIYYTGFNSYAKQKRTFSALKGSFMGVGLGLITYAIFK
ncbi:MAG TPA: hypothetical protein EYG85_11650 [Crocinitomix sp.]|nr:hypothetical protein [Crocinitomix sp.]